MIEKLYISYQKKRVNPNKITKANKRDIYANHKRSFLELENLFF